MLHPTKTATPDEADLLGEWHPLVDQLGSTHGLVTLNAVSRLLQLRRVENLATLRAFLEAYQTHVLVPIELPAVQRAHRHVSRNQTRELIAFDQELAREPLLAEFATPSQRVGQWHLRRFRPMRDVRLVQRYIAAVEAGQAHGWHTLVFGLTVSIYSLPMRPCLALYERNVLRGFMDAAGRALRLREADCRNLLMELCSELPELNDEESREAEADVGPAR